MTTVVAVLMKPNAIVVTNMPGIRKSRYASPLSPVPPPGGFMAPPKT